MISDRADSLEEKEMRVGAARKEERHEGGESKGTAGGREESKREIKGDYLPMR